MTPKFRTVSIAVATVLVLAISTEAAFAWACHAKSRVGEGWGYSPVLQTAREEAKLKCMTTTPRRLACRIVSCSQKGPSFLGR